MASARRQQLIETALALFSREGFHATGIDRILAEAGVAKKTLYHHFRSKDELILAALRLRDERFRDDFMTRAETRGAGRPAATLLALFDVLAGHADDEAFCGCAFINACAEFSDAASPVHALAAEHKQRLQDWICGHARQAGAREPAALARQLGLLMDGAIVAAQVAGGSEGAKQAKQAARALLAAQGVEAS